MELFRKHNYNPLSGCLPVVLQLPIFIGLYNALSNAVDLRMAPFLWIDNLAAPDALFQLPFRIPYLRTGLQPAAADHDRAVRRAAEDVHAAAGRRAAGDAVQDDERT